MTKPVDKVLLRARINSCLLKRRQRARELEQFFPPEVVARLLDRPELLRTGARPRPASCSATSAASAGSASGCSTRRRRWCIGSAPSWKRWTSACCATRACWSISSATSCWPCGAPLRTQPDHARRACRAALDMLACVSRLSRRLEGRHRRGDVPSASASTAGRSASATRARNDASSTGRSATRSTWPAASRGRRSTSRRGCC